MPKPTIAELEAILSSDDVGPPVTINPDGTITMEPRIPWPDPTPEMLASPQFEAVWQCIKGWDINVPDAYHGYCGATGNHVRAILDALEKAAVTSGVRTK